MQLVVESSPFPTSKDVLYILNLNFIPRAAFGMYREDMSHNFSINLSSHKIKLSKLKGTGNGQGNK